jgi:hypothetical protein
MQKARVIGRVNSFMGNPLVKVGFLALACDLPAS